MKMINKNIVTVASMALLLGACVANPPAQKPQEKPAQKPQEKIVVVEKQCDVAQLANRQAGFGVQLWAKDPGPYFVGQYLKLNMRPMADSYVSLYAVTSSCKTYQLLDNYKVTGGQTLDFPSQGSGINLRMKPPAGTETYIMIATRSPFSWLAGSDVLSAGAIKSLDLSPAQLRSRLQEATGRLNPHNWNTHTIKLSIRG